MAPLKKHPHNLAPAIAVVVCLFLAAIGCQVYGPDCIEDDGIYAEMSLEPLITGDVVIRFSFPDWQPDTRYFYLAAGTVPVPADNLPFDPRIFRAPPVSA